MEPRIQYAPTGDGVSIAFSTLGEGLPFVYTPSGPYQHIQLEWGFPEIRHWYERLAERRRLVLYNERGRGLSGGDIADYSLDTEVRDLEAVVDDLDLERFAIFGSYHGGPAAIAYAARHPQRVSELILWQTWSRARDRFTGLPRVLALRSLLEQDWELYTETLAHEFMGWPEGDPARRFAAFVREVTSPEAMLTFFRATNDYDVTDLLPQLHMPTLVLHRRGHFRTPVEIARGLVSRIPDARLVLLEDTGGQPYLGDTNSVLSAIGEFLGDGKESVTQASPSPAGAVHTILFTDVEGSTALTERLGDAKARDLLGEHERITRDVLKAHGGTQVKTMGDGFMASFGSVTRAVECAVALQRAFEARDKGQETRDRTPAEPIRIRIGLTAGEPVEEEGDLFGATVILASRIAAMAEGGEILASNTVRQLAAGKGFLFSDRGDAALRGFETPVRLYDVRWEEGALTPAADLQVRRGGTPTAEPEGFPAPTPARPPPPTYAYTVWYGTNRRMLSTEHPDRGFSSAREADLRTIHYGTCEVSIPRTHKFGSIGSSWLKRWSTRSDDRLKLRRIRPAAEPDFWTLVESELGKWEESERQALVYVHGYSCSFEAAALRAAQIGFDLKATGVTAFFSWPSKGRTEDYTADEATIEACEVAINEFLVKLARDVGAERVHVIAHSMGNRGLLRVMQRIQADVEHHSAVKFGQIFLAAPDVDAELFCQLATVYPQLTRRTTLYVSPSDRAVGLSKWLHAAPRAGFTPPVTCVPGIDTVEIPDFDLDVLGHSYYAKAAGVLSDMFTLLRHDSPPDQRQRLQAARRDDGTSYWTMGR